MLPGYRDFRSIFVLHRNVEDTPGPPNISGSMWPNLVKVFSTQVSVHYRQEPPSSISDLRTHCPRNVDQLVWSKWRWKSKWVLDKPISQALTVGGREGWSINWLPSTLWMPIRQHSLSLTLAFSDWDSLYHALDSHAWFSYQTSVSSRRALDVNNWRNVIFLQFGDDLKGFRECHFWYPWNSI